MQMYHDIIMDHYRMPRNKGKLDAPNVVSRSHNPSCGDSVTICGTVTQEIVTQLMFEGAGCVLSQASASLLTTQLSGKTIAEIMALESDAFVSQLGIPIGPIRRKCVLLALDALKQALTQYTQE